MGSGGDEGHLNFTNPDNSLTEPSPLALHDHALSAAWQLTSAIRRDLEGVYLWPGLEAAAKAGAAYPELPFQDFLVFEKILKDFKWFFGVETFDFVYRLDLRTGKMEFRGKEAPGSEVTQFLKTFLKEQASLGSAAAKRVQAGIKIYGSGDVERVLVFAIEPGSGPDAKVAFGFQTDLSPIAGPASCCEMVSRCR